MAPRQLMNTIGGRIILNHAINRFIATSQCITMNYLSLSHKFEGNYLSCLHDSADG